MNVYTLSDFQNEFPSVESCLDWLIHNHWPEGIFCVTEGKITPHYLMKTRKSYSCQECGNHFHPTAGTIFHKSRTALPIWFFVIYKYAQSQGKISAKQIERETGVTYKTAWRMRTLIQQMLYKENDDFWESNIGGKSVRKQKIGSTDNRNAIMLQGNNSSQINSFPFNDEIRFYNRLQAMGNDPNKAFDYQNMPKIGDFQTDKREEPRGQRLSWIQALINKVIPKPNRTRFLKKEPHNSRTDN